MSTKAEMEAVAEAIYREGWNAALEAAIKVVANKEGPYRAIMSAKHIRELKK